VEVRAFEGAGGLGLMVLSGPPGEASKPVAPTIIDDGSREEPDGETDDPVSALAKIQLTLSGRGYESPVFVVRDGRVAPGELRTHDIVMGPGCGMVVGMAGPRGIDLDLYLSDPEGRPVDADTGVDF